MNMMRRTQNTIRESLPPISVAWPSIDVSLATIDVAWLSIDVSLATIDVEWPSIDVSLATIDVEWPSINVSWPGLARPPTTCDGGPTKVMGGQPRPSLGMMIGCPYGG
jgi:hypothetical protein